jgi:hypothetical protein
MPPDNRTKPEHKAPSPSTIEALFACAFLPIVYGTTRPDPGVDVDNIRWALRLGKLAAKLMAEE